MVQCPFENCTLKCKNKKLHRAKYAMMDKRRSMKVDPYVSTETVELVSVSERYTYMPMFYEEQFMAPPSGDRPSILFTQVRQRPIRTNIYA